MHGKVQTVRHQAVSRRKDSRLAVALDSEQNSIHVKDIVKVIDGPHSVCKIVCAMLLVSLVSFTSRNCVVRTVSCQRERKLIPLYLTQNVDNILRAFCL